MISKEVLAELSDYFSDPHIYWKKVILNLYQDPCELIFPARNDDGSKIENTELTHIKNLAKFSENIGLSHEISQSVNDINKVVLASDGNVKELISAFIVWYLESVFERLEQWGYVEFKLNIKSNHDSFDYCTWHITEKGIAAGLALQAHEDNEKRYLHTQVSSKRIFWVSIFALIILTVAIGLNYKRFDLYEKKLNSLSYAQGALDKNLSATENIKISKLPAENIE
jgi:hypothetical protein